MKADALSLDNATALAVVAYLRGRCFPEARAIKVDRGFGVEVSPGRMVIVDPDDWHSDGKAIIRALIKKAKDGDLEAVWFLMERGDFTLPSFSVDGYPEI